MRGIVVGCLLLTLATGAEAQDTQPRLLGEGVVSTGDNEFATTLTPNGNTAFWTLSAPNVFVFPFVILQTTRTGTGWSAPQIAPFSGTGYSDGDPSLSPDGKRMVFMSRRPVTGTTARADFDIWMYDYDTRRIQHIDAIASDSMDIAPSISANYTVYFCSSRAGGKGGGDIYRSRYVNGRYETPENVPGVNTDAGESNVYVAPDESYLIFSGVRPGGVGAADLYIAERKADGSYDVGRPLRNVNTPFDDYAPYVSPDGLTLYFSSRRTLPSPPVGSSFAEVQRRFRSPGNGNADIYSVPLASAR